MEIEPRLLVWLLALLFVGWLLAAAGWTAFIVGRGGFGRARRRRAETAETRTRDHIRQLEKQKVQEVADQLEAEAQRMGQKHSRKAIEREARRLLMEAGTGRTI